MRKKYEPFFCFWKWICNANILNVAIKIIIQNLELYKLYYLSFHYGAKFENSLIHESKLFFLSRLYFFRKLVTFLFPMKTKFCEENKYPVGKYINLYGYRSAGQIKRSKFKKWPNGHIFTRKTRHHFIVPIHTLYSTPRGPETKKILMNKNVTK